MKNVLIDPSNERKIVDFRKLGFKDVLALGRYSYAHAHEPLPGHSHGDMFEVCYLDEGTQRYEVEGKEYILKGGDVFVTFPNEVHGSGVFLQSRGRLYWMLIALPSKRERFLNLPPKDGQELVGRLLNIFRCHFKGGSQLKSHLERIFSAHDGSDMTLKSAKIKNRVLLFLLEVLERAEHHTRNVITPPIKASLRYIDEQIFEEMPQIPDLARIAGLSVSRFKARFKEETGLSPGSCIVQRRVERAKELLKNTGLPITDIGFQLGFSTSQYFATVFKRLTTMKPVEWRSKYECGMKE